MATRPRDTPDGPFPPNAGLCGKFGGAERWKTCQQQRLVRFTLQDTEP